MAISRRSILKMTGLGVLGMLSPADGRPASGADGTASAPAPGVPFTGTRWWENPARLRSGRARPSGIMNWGSAESLRKYETEVAFLDCGTQRSINKLPSWEALAGGPLGATDTIDPKSQLDWPGTPIGVLMDHIPAGKGWLIWGVWAMKTGEAAKTQGRVWKDVANGKFDPYYVDLGTRARKTLQGKGWPLDCLLLRWNKEFNQWEKMIRGDLGDGGYGDLEAVQLCRKHGIPFCHDEWSPRFEPKLACPIPASIYQWTREFWDTLEERHGVPLAFDCVYHANTLDPSLSAEWARGVDVFKKLWAGKKPPPPPT